MAGVSLLCPALRGQRFGGADRLDREALDEGVARRRCIVRAGLGGEGHPGEGVGGVGGAVLFQQEERQIVLGGAVALAGGGRVPAERGGGVPGFRREPAGVELRLGHAADRGGDEAHVGLAPVAVGEGQLAEAESGFGQALGGGFIVPARGVAPAGGGLGAERLDGEAQIELRLGVAGLRLGGVVAGGMFEVVVGGDLAGRWGRRQQAEGER